MIDYLKIHSMPLCESCSYTVIALGSLGFIAVALFLYYAPRKTNEYFEGIVRFTTPWQNVDRITIENVIANYCTSYALVSAQSIDHKKIIVYAYEIKLKNDHSHDSFTRALKGLRNICNVKLIM